MAFRNFWTIKDGKIAKGVVSFKWEPGMSVAQKRRSCVHMHSALNVYLDLYPALDISSASTEKLGVELSAFNLMLNGKSVECWYQGSKVYSNVGHMKHLYDADSLTAKLSMKQENKGALIGFKLIDVDYPMNPKTVFYDYLYLQGLMQYEERDKVLDYNVFTDVQAVLDIDACQARSVCIYKLLHTQGNLYIVDDFDKFKEWHKVYVEDTYDIKGYTGDVRKLADGSYKILDIKLSAYNLVGSLYFCKLAEKDGCYRYEVKQKVANPEVIIYTDGLLDDLCALQELSKHYKSAVVILSNCDDLSKSEYAADRYNPFMLLNDLSNWFKECTLVLDECGLHNICNFTKGFDVYCLCKATAIMHDIDLISKADNVYAMIGSSNNFDSNDGEWNASQDIEAYKQLLEVIGSKGNWVQYTSTDCESFKRSNNTNPEQLKYYKQYMSKMNKLNEHTCCYDLQCVYMALKI